MAESFKQGGRTSRQILTDATYAGGMYYTNKPIDTGYNKRLINYVFDINAVSLLTRAPLRLDKNYPIERKINDYTPAFIMSGMRTTDFSKECLEQTGEPLLEDKATTALVSYTPVSETEVLPIVDNTIEDAAAADLGGVLDLSKTCSICVSSMYDDGSTSEYYIPLYVPLYTPPLTSFNNIPFATLDYMRRPLATNAYNGKVYALGFTHYKNGVTPQMFFGDSSWWTGWNPSQINPENNLNYFNVIRNAYIPYASEAANGMYNMMANNPYRFANDPSQTAERLFVTGMNFYDYETNNILMRGKVNKKIKIRVYYRYNGNVYSDYEFLFRWKDEGSDTFHEIKRVRSSVEGDVRVTFVIPGDLVQVYCTAINVTNPDKPVMESDVFLRIDSRTSSMTEVVNNFILNQATGVTYWKWRTVVYGIKTAKNAIFVSLFNDPTYYPYPTFFEEFDDPVIYATEYMGKLLVFTIKEIWQLALNDDGWNWTKTLVQGNLALNEEDACYITVIKNFVMFKQQNYFYLIVPYASTAGDLAISNISEPITELLNDLNGFVRDLLRDVYGYVDTYALHKVQTYVVANDIHIVMSFLVKPEQYLNIELIYSTLSRSWIVHSYATNELFVPHALRSQKYAQLYSIMNQSIDVLYFDEDAQTLDDVYGQNFPNWQLLDTGYRKLATEFRKHFLEIQYKVRFEQATVLRFATEIWIDNIEVKAADTKYVPYMIPNPGNPDEMILSVEPEYQFDNTMSSFKDLTSTGTPTPTYWEFLVPRVTPHLLWRIRQRGHAKGEAPRLILRSRNVEKFTLLENAWVLRLMNAR